MSRIYKKKTKQTKRKFHLCTHLFMDWWGDDDDFASRFHFDFSSPVNFFAHMKMK
jgi:hypothetical protein